MIIRLGDIGEEVGLLQKNLVRAGYEIEVSHFFDADTEAAVMDFQRAARLVVDGIAGPKTRAALIGGRNPKHLTDADLVQAAEKLGVPVAAIRAFNEVESRGQGFMTDGRPAILFERHVFFERLEEHNIDPEPHAAKSPNICSQKRGGYYGGAAEYTRLASAKMINTAAAYESASWGSFQIMGYHWKALGYESIDAFIEAMKRSEADHLAALVRFIEIDPALLAAIKSKKWATVARIYNGPDFARHMYDKRLEAAFKRFSPSVKLAA